MKILITGANRGLGLSLTEEALKRGHTVIATCRTESEELCVLATAFPERLDIQPMDVASEASVREAAVRIETTHGSIDALVNNAAVLLESKYFAGDPVVETPLADFETTLDINVMGPIRVTHYFAPLLYRSNAPWLLNVTSEGAALKPAGSHYMAYAISKYALNMYTQKVRNYYHEQKVGCPVRIYIVHPGRMHTLMGVENAQIEPEVPAQGMLDILDGKIQVPPMEIPFIDYLGHPMPDHYIAEA